jgi:hypothetical protein
MEDFKGTLEAQALAGPVVELAEEAVGVFVGAALPGVVGMGKGDRQVEPFLQFGGPGKLVAVGMRRTAYSIQNRNE